MPRLANVVLGHRGPSLAEEEAELDAFEESELLAPPKPSKPRPDPASTPCGGTLLRGAVFALLALLLVSIGLLFLGSSSWPGHRSRSGLWRRPPSHQGKRGAILPLPIGGIERNKGSEEQRSNGTRGQSHPPSSVSPGSPPPSPPFHPDEALVSTPSPLSPLLTPESPPLPPSPPFQDVVLLVSLFHPTGPQMTNPHFRELFAATGVNLQNPHFSEVHVLFESPSPMCAALPGLLRKHVPDLKSGDLSKLRCVDIQKRPTYADLFGYANENLTQKVVALANTDIVFDETIGLVDGPELSNGNGAFVLGVHIPKRQGLYRKVFGRECDRTSSVEPTSHCYMGKVDGEPHESMGSSWDVFVFASPMPRPKMGRGVAGLDIFTSAMHAENAAAYAMQVSLSPFPDPLSFSFPFATLVPFPFP